MAALTIHQAAGRGALQLVQRMVLHENAQVDARDKHGKTPLMHAAQWGAYVGRYLGGGSGGGRCGWD